MDMPHGDIHKKKLKKNLAILGMILLWCALIWLVTMIKIANTANAADYRQPLKNPYASTSPLKNPYESGKALNNPYTGQNPLKNPYTDHNPLNNPYEGEPPLRNPYTGRNYSGLGVSGKKVDTQGPMLKSRQARMAKTFETQQQWITDYRDAEQTRYQEDEDMKARRNGHSDHIVATYDGWMDDYGAKESTRLAAAEALDLQRDAHNGKMKANPQQWWDGWAARQAEKSE